MILGAGGEMLPGKIGKEPFRFMFTLQMKWKPFEVVAISAEPGAVTALRREGKKLAPYHFRKPMHCFAGIHMAVLIHELPVVC